LFILGLYLLCFTHVRLRFVSQILHIKLN